MEALMDEIKSYSNPNVLNVLIMSHIRHGSKENNWSR